jgi:hypothetical protein
MADIKAVQDRLKQANEIYDLPIVDEAGQPYLSKDGLRQSSIGIVGRDSKAYRDATEAFSKKVSQMPAVQRESVDWRRGYALCGVRRLTDWENGDEPFPYSEENAAVLLAAEHILEQVENGIRRHGSFFVKPSTS